MQATETVSAAIATEKAEVSHAEHSHPSTTQLHLNFTCFFIFYVFSFPRVVQFVSGFDGARDITLGAVTTSSLHVLQAVIIYYCGHSHTFRLSVSCPFSLLHTLHHILKSRDATYSNFDRLHVLWNF